MVDRQSSKDSYYQQQLAQAAWANFGRAGGYPGYPGASPATPSMASHAPSTAAHYENYMQQLQQLASAQSAFGGAANPNASYGTPFAFPPGHPMHFPGISNYTRPLPAHSPLPAHMKNNSSSTPSPLSSSSLPAHMRSNPYQQTTNYHNLNSAYAAYGMAGQGGSSSYSQAQEQERSRQIQARGATQTQSAPQSRASSQDPAQRTGLPNGGPSTSDVNSAYTQLQQLQQLQSAYNQATTAGMAARESASKDAAKAKHSAASNGGYPYPGYQQPSTTNPPTAGSPFSGSNPSMGNNYDEIAATLLNRFGPQFSPQLLMEMTKGYNQMAFSQSLASSQQRAGKQGAGKSGTQSSRREDTQAKTAEAAAAQFQKSQLEAYRNSGASQEKPAKEQHEILQALLHQHAQQSKEQQNKEHAKEGARNQTFPSGFNPNLFKTGSQPSVDTDKSKNQSGVGGGGKTESKTKSANSLPHMGIPGHPGGIPPGAYGAWAGFLNQGMTGSTIASTQGGNSTKPVNSSKDSLPSQGKTDVQPTTMNKPSLDIEATSNAPLARPGMGLGIPTARMTSPGPPKTSPVGLPNTAMSTTPSMTSPQCPTDLRMTSPAMGSGSKMTSSSIGPGPKMTSPTFGSSGPSPKMPISGGQGPRMTSPPYGSGPPITKPNSLPTDTRMGNPQAGFGLEMISPPISSGSLTSQGQSDVPMTGMGHTDVRMTIPRQSEAGMVASSNSCTKMTDSGHSDPRMTGPGHGDLRLSGSGDGNPRMTVPGHSDPRMTGPGHNDLRMTGPGLSDPRMTGPGQRMTGPGQSELRMAGPGTSELRMSGPGHGDSRMIGPGHSDTRMTGPGHTDLRMMGPGHADLRMTGPGHNDLRMTGPGHSDPRMMGSNHNAQRMSLGYGDIRMGGPRHGDPRMITMGPGQIDPRMPGPAHNMRQMGPGHNDIRMTGPSHSEVKMMGSGQSDARMPGPAHTDSRMMGPGSSDARMPGIGTSELKVPGHGNNDARALGQENSDLRMKGMPPPNGPQMTSPQLTNPQCGSSDGKMNSSPVALNLNNIRSPPQDGLRMASPPGQSPYPRPPGPPHMMSPHGQISPQITSPQGPVPPQMTSPRSFSSSHEQPQVSPHMTSPQGPLTSQMGSPPGQMSPCITSPQGNMNLHMTSPHGQISPQMSSPQCSMPGSAHMSPQMSSHSQASPQIPSPHAQKVLPINSPHDKNSYITSPSEKSSSLNSSPEKNLHISAPPEKSPEISPSLSSHPSHLENSPDQSPPYTQPYPSLATPASYSRPTTPTPPPSSISSVVSATRKATESPRLDTPPGLVGNHRLDTPPGIGVHHPIQPPSHPINQQPKDLPPQQTHHPPSQPSIESPTTPSTNSPIYAPTPTQREPAIPQAHFSDAPPPSPFYNSEDAGGRHSLPIPTLPSKRGSSIPSPTPPKTATVPPSPRPNSPPPSQPNFPPSSHPLLPPHQLIPPHFSHALAHSVASQLSVPSLHSTSGMPFGLAGLASMTNKLKESEYSRTSKPPKKSSRDPGPLKGLYKMQQELKGGRPFSNTTAPSYAPPASNALATSLPGSPRLPPAPSLPMSENKNSLKSIDLSSHSTPSRDRMEIKNSGIPGPGAVTWKRKSLEDSPVMQGKAKKGRFENKIMPTYSNAHEDFDDDPYAFDDDRESENYGKNGKGPVYKYKNALLSREPEINTSRVGREPQVTPAKPPEINRSGQRETELESSPEYIPGKPRETQLTPIKSRESQFGSERPRESQLSLGLFGESQPSPTASRESQPSPTRSRDSPPSPDMSPGRLVLQEPELTPEPVKPSPVPSLPLDCDNSVINNKPVFSSKESSASSDDNSRSSLGHHSHSKKSKVKRPKHDDWIVAEPSNKSSDPEKVRDKKDERRDNLNRKGPLWGLPKAAESILPKPQKSVEKPPPRDKTNSVPKPEPRAKDGKVSVNDVWLQAFGGVKTKKRPVERETPPKKIVKVEREEKTVQSIMRIPPEMRRKPRPDFGGLIHFSPDWVRSVRRHHERCRIPPSLDSSSKLKPKILAGQSTPKKNYEDFARKNMVSPPDIHAMERERAEVFSRAIEMEKSEDSSGSVALPSIVDAILANRKKLRATSKMGRMYKLPSERLDKEKKKALAVARMEEMKRRDGNIGMLPTPGLPLLTEDTRDVLMGSNFGNFRRQTLLRYFDRLGEAGDLKAQLLDWHPEVLESKTRRQTSLTKAVTSVKEIFGFEVPGKGSGVKTSSSSAKANSTSSAKVNSTSSAKTSVTSSAKTSVTSSATKEKETPIEEAVPKVEEKEKPVKRERVKKEPKSQPVKAVDEGEEVSCYSQEIGEPTELDNLLQGELGNFALDLLDDNPSWSKRVTIQNLVIFETIEPALVKKKKGGKKKRSRKSGLDFNSRSKRAKSSRDVSRAGSPSPPEEVHEIEYNINNVIAESNRWVVDKNAGETILHRAAKMGYPDVVAYAVDMLGVSVMEKDYAGLTPLHKASYKGHDPIVKVLLKYGADPSSGVKGTRALHEAIEGISRDCVYTLLTYGADPLLHDYSGNMPIDLADNDPDMKHYLYNILADLAGNPPKVRGILPENAKPATRWNVSHRPDFHQPPESLEVSGASHSGGSSSSNKVSDDNDNLLFEVTSHLTPNYFQFRDREGVFVLYRDLKEYVRKYCHKTDIRAKGELLELGKTEFLKQSHCAMLDRRNLTVKTEKDEKDKDSKKEETVLLVKVDKFVKKLLNVESIPVAW